MCNRADGWLSPFPPAFRKMFQVRIHLSMPFAEPKHVVSTNNKKVNGLVTLMDNKEQILSQIK
jgi:hypothetical protein